MIISALFFGTLQAAVKASLLSRPKARYRLFVSEFTSSFRVTGQSSQLVQNQWLLALNAALALVS